MSSPRVTSIQTPKSRALASLRAARAINDKLLKGFPSANLLTQNAATDGHVLWQVGHLGLSASWFASLIDGAPVGVPAKYNELFGPGSKPMPDGGIYPAYSDVSRYYETEFKRLCEAAEQTPDIDITLPPAFDSGGFVNDRLHAIELCVWHEGWHGGQISTLRRSLGLPGIMGPG